MAKRLIGNGSLGVEAEPSTSADKLRGSIEHSHDKQVVFGPIFEQSGDGFGAKSAELLEKRGEAGAMFDADSSTEEAIWGPMETRWSHPIVSVNERPSSAASTTL